MSTDNPKPEWPFPMVTAENATEKPEPVVEDHTVEPQASDQPTVFPAGTYRIYLGGRGSEVGIGKITRAQFEFWQEHEDELSEALSDDDYDYDAIDAPEDARFGQPYYEYSDVACECGPNIDSTWVEIINAQDQVVYEGAFEELVSVIDNTLMNRESYESAVDQVTEEYIQFLSPGHYVFWVQGGKGTYIDTVVECAEEFDLTKLRFHTADIDGLEVISGVVYDGQDLDNDGGDWWGKYSDYSVHEVLAPEQDHD